MSGYEPSGDSPFDAAIRHWIEQHRAVEVYSTPELDEFASCADAQLSKPVLAGDPLLTAFAHDGRAEILARHEA